MVQVRVLVVMSNPSIANAPAGIASPRPKTQVNGIAHLWNLGEGKHRIERTVFQIQIPFLPIFSAHCLVFFRRKRILLFVPEVEKEREEDQNEGMRGHRAVVQERVQFAHDASRVPLHHVNRLKQNIR